MPTADSAPERWRYKEQTRMKHAVLSNCLTRWGSILRKPGTSEPQTLHYVDSFAEVAEYRPGRSSYIRDAAYTRKGRGLQ